MLYPIKNSTKFNEAVISDLKKLYPELNIRLNRADPRFILVSRVIGTQNVDTNPISITETVEIHLSEALSYLHLHFVFLCIVGLTMYNTPPTPPSKDGNDDDYKYVHYIYE